MNIIEHTKFSIGQTVYAVRYPSYDEDSKQFELGVYEHTIKLIKLVIDENGTYESYFLSGLKSYEGENWFSEITWTNKCSEGIFQLKEEAEQYLEMINKRCED